MCKQRGVRENERERDLLLFTALVLGMLRAAPGVLEPKQVYHMVVRLPSIEPLLALSKGI